MGSITGFNLQQLGWQLGLSSLHSLSLALNNKAN
jgi:hypothetical protein